MKTLFIMSLWFAACTPRTVTYNQHDMPHNKGHVLSVDLKTGERFSFAEPGGLIMEQGHTVFGRTTTYQFVAISTAQVESVYCGRPVDVSTLDTTMKISRLTTKAHQTHQFDPSGARLYVNHRFVTGTTVNGSVVQLPMDRVAEGLKLLNYEQVKTGEDFKIFFGTLGIIGLVILRVMAEIHSSNNK